NCHIIDFRRDNGTILQALLFFEEFKNLYDNTMNIFKNKKFNSTLLKPTINIRKLKHFNNTHSNDNNNSNYQFYKSNHNFNTIIIQSDDNNDNDINDTNNNNNDIMSKKYKIEHVRSSSDLT